MEKSARQHNLAIIMLSVTAIVWGTGFLFTNSLLNNGFNDIPVALNAVRFLAGTIALLAVFCRKIKFSKNMFLYGSISGAMLCAGFCLQLIGLKHTTPAACGFYTAAYALFVPFLAWFFLKKRPTMLTIVGIVLALAGLLLLNMQSFNSETMWDREILLGNMLTLGGSLFFAAQIVLADFALKKKNLDVTSFSVVQVTFCTLFMVLTSLIAESKKYSATVINWNVCWWQLMIVAVLGTAFAYFSQTFAQNHLSPSETSIILACESPVGAVLSVILGVDPFSWQLCVGGVLVLGAVVIIEILPHFTETKALEVPVATEQSAEQTEQTTETTDNPTEKEQ